MRARNAAASAASALTRSQLPMPQAGAQEHPIEGEDCTRHHTHSLFVADVSLAMDHEGADAAATESCAQFTT